MNVQKSGLTGTVVAIVAVLLVAIAGLGAQLIIQQPQQALTQTVTQTVSGAGVTTTLSTTVTSLQTQAANNTIDLRANSTVVLGVVGTGISESNRVRFIIGTLTNPTIKVKVGTKIQIFFHSEDLQGLAAHSFVILSGDYPPFPWFSPQSDLTPVFPGASTPIPTNPPKDQFILFFTADKPGTFWYICAVPHHAVNGMYGQFIVEG